MLERQKICIKGWLFWIGKAKPKHNIYYVPEYVRTWKWAKYGLSIREPGLLSDWKTQEIIDAHNSVVEYLETNKKARKKYKADQTGELKYFDILTLAEL